MVDLLHHPPHDEHDDEADGDGDDRGDEEGQGQLTEVHLGAGHGCRHRRLEDDEGGGIVEQPFTLQGRHDPPRYRDSSRDRIDGDGVRRGEHGAEGHRRRDRDPGDEEDRSSGHCRHRHPDESDRHAQDRAPADGEESPRGLLRGGEQEGWQEQRQNEIGFDGDLGERGNERAGDADDDHESRPGEAQLLAHAHDHAGCGTESDDHQQSRHARLLDMGGMNAHRYNGIDVRKHRLHEGAPGKDSERDPHQVSAPDQRYFGRIPLCLTQLYSPWKRTQSRRFRSTSLRLGTRCRAR